MASRATWRGFLKVSELVCAVGLYTAVSTSERVAFHTLNRSTGNRVSRIFADRETDKPVKPEDQIKGYETGKDEYVILSPDEIASAVPGSDKTLTVERFIPCGTLDEVYFDRPYYLAPSDPVAEKAFVVLREGMRAKAVAGLARTVLFRRVRTVLIRAHDAGMIATILNYDYEVRSTKEAFDGIPAMKIKGEMLDLAKHIIKTKRGKFDPAKFEDRYEAALADVVKAKLEGRPIEAAPKRESAKVIDLMDALRKSAAGASRVSKKPKAGAKTTGKKSPATNRPPRRTGRSDAATRTRKAG